MAFTINEFECIYKRCFSRAMGLATRLLYDEEEARDAVQQVFVSLWESKLKIDNPDAFVFRAVRNACLNRITATDIHDRVKKLYSLEIQTSENIDQRIDEVHEAVARLPERQQQVVKEIFTDGNSYRDAADNLNLSVSSVNKHVVNALKALRLQLKSTKS